MAEPHQQAMDSLPDARLLRQRASPPVASSSDPLYPATTVSRFRQPYTVESLCQADAMMEATSWTCRELGGKPGYFASPRRLLEFKLLLLSVRVPLPWRSCAWPGSGQQLAVHLIRSTSDCRMTVTVPIAWIPLACMNLQFINRGSLCLPSRV